jgi:NMT1/THI5 like
MNTERGGPSRRAFIRGLTLAGAASALGLDPARVAAEPPPETDKLTVVHSPAVCEAPAFVAEELLRGEGFTDVQYVMKPGGNPYLNAVGSGEGDILLSFAASVIHRMEGDNSLLFLAGVHIGCLEVFGTKGIRSIRDLRGKTIAVVDLPSVQYILLAPMLAYVGLNPRSDVNWVTYPVAEQVRLLAEEKIPPRVPTVRPGTPRKEDRPCHHQHCNGSSVVAILLLHGRCQPTVRAEESSRNQTCTPRPPESDGHLRTRAGARRPAHPGPALTTICAGAGLRLRSPVAEGDSVR